MGSLVPVSVSIRAFQSSHVHQVLHGGKSLGQGRPPTWQWHVLPCALAEHRGSLVFDTHLHELLCLGSVTVGPLVSALFPCLPFGLNSSSAVDPWFWLFLTSGSLVSAAPSWWPHRVGASLLLSLRSLLPPQPWWLQLGCSLALAASFRGLPGFDECCLATSRWCRLRRGLSGGWPVGPDGE